MCVVSMCVCRCVGLRRNAIRLRGCDGSQQQQTKGEEEEEGGTLLLIGEEVLCECVYVTDVDCLSKEEEGTVFAFC